MKPTAVPLSTEPPRLTTGVEGDDDNTCTVTADGADML